MVSQQLGLCLNEGNGQKHDSAVNLHPAMIKEMVRKRILLQIALCILVINLLMIDTNEASSLHSGYELTE